MTDTLQGKCDCGRVAITVPALPEQINACPCRYCRQIGARWAYYAVGNATIEGATAVYRRASRVLEFHRCTECGVSTHWVAPSGELGYMGVNMAAFADEMVAGIPVVIEA